MTLKYNLQKLENTFEGMVEFMNQKIKGINKNIKSIEDEIEESDDIATILNSYGISIEK
jgi:aspartate ammonia-lyase